MDAATIPAYVRMQQNNFNALSLLMLTNYLFPESTELKDGDEFDFLIIGGGTAGCVMANRLVKANFKVLVLEAGEDTPFESFLPGTLGFLPGSRIDWNYTAEPNYFSERCHSSSRVKLTAGRVLGGSSALNLMVVTRGHYTDYHRWAVAANDSSWEFKHLLPLFIKNERLLAPQIANSLLRKYRGIGGKPPDAPGGGKGTLGISIDNSTTVCNYLRSFKEMGNKLVVDLNGFTKGYTRSLFSIADGQRQSTSYAYLTPAYIQDSKTHPKLFVSKNTFVTKIVFDERKNAIGVMAEINNRKPIFLKARYEVILSAGAINSPQILMLSGIGKKKHLEEKNITVISDLPVGENFQDNIAVTVIQKTKISTFQTRTNLKEFPAATIVGLKSVKPHKKRPDYGTISYIIKVREAVLLFCIQDFDLQPEICNRLYKEDFDRELFHTQIFDLNAKSRGRVSLKTADPRDAPVIHAGYFSKKEDVKTIIEYVKDLAQIQNTTFFKNAGGRIWCPTENCCKKRNIDDYWKCYAYCMSNSIWNFCGTCSMGSVVDSTLKVYGVQKLRVVDASVMPHPVSGGNYMATIVVAQKASDMIKKEWKK